MLKIMRSYSCSFFQNKAFRKKIKKKRQKVPWYSDSDTLTSHAAHRLDCDYISSPADYRRKDQQKETKEVWRREMIDSPIPSPSIPPSFIIISKYLFMYEQALVTVTHPTPRGKEVLNDKVCSGCNREQEIVGSRLTNK